MPSPVQVTHRPYRAGVRGLLRVFSTAVLTGASLVAPAAVTHVAASENQGGAPQVVINGGGGALSDGSDGLQIILNRSTDGHDEYLRYNTLQTVGTGIVSPAAGSQARQPRRAAAAPGLQVARFLPRKRCSSRRAVSLRRSPPRIRGSCSS